MSDFGVITLDTTFDMTGQGSDSAKLMVELDRPPLPFMPFLPPCVQKCQNAL